MKKLKILIIGIFTLLSIQSFGQSWEQYIDFPGTDSFQYYMTPNVDKTINDEYITLPGFIYPNYYQQFMRIDTNGVMNWTTMNDFPTDFYVGKIIATNDDYYITVGSSWDSLTIAKYDIFGDTVWTRKHGVLSNTQYDFYPGDAIQTQDGNIVIIGTERQVPSGNNRVVKAVKIDYSNGNIIWNQNHTISSLFSINWSLGGITENNNNELVIAGFRKISSSQSNVLYLLQLNSLGNKINDHFYTLTTSYSNIGVISTSTDGYIIKGTSIILKVDSQWNEIWRITNVPFSINDFMETQDNSIVVVGRNTLGHNGEMQKYDSNGNLLWSKSHISTTSNVYFQSQFSTIKETDNGDYMLFGSATRSIPGYNHQMYIARLNTDGEVSSSAITGSVFNDQNADCQLNTNENLLNTQTLFTVVNSSNDTTFHITDAQGNYFIPVSSGSYSISPVAYGNNWISCSNTVTVNPNDTITQDLGLQPMTACSELEVNVTAPTLVRCFQNTYQVNYSNIGTQNETGVYIEIEFDPFLIVNAASIPYTQNGNIYTFQIGNLNINQSGQFTVDVTVDCNAQLGQAHCVNATIFPNQICNLGGTPWQGATIIADAFCAPNDSVTFRLENVGAGNMTQARNYWVIEDQILPLQGTYQLNAGQDTTFTLPTNGYTYQIQAEQEITHPYSVNSTSSNVISAATFGCSSDSSIAVNGLINQFNLDDYVSYVDDDCQVNVGSYGSNYPNDKQAFPVGYGSNNMINQNTTIEYLLRFQNTGTATATNVIVEDQIDISALDLSTLQLQASSHPYILEINNGNTLVFKFNNIMLPDSASNPTASNGFVRFKITQNLNNPVGTIIQNSATTYFDLNAPITTNTTFHTVGQSFPPTLPTCQTTFTINQLNNTGLTQLVANPSSNTPLTYDWDFGNGQTLQSTNPTINYNFTPGDSLYICLTVTDSIGCVATSCQHYVVPGLSACIADFTAYYYITTNPTNSTNTVQLLGHPTGIAPFTFLWDFGNGQTLQTTDSTANYTYSLNDTVYICLTITDSVGCVATSCQYIYFPSPDSCQTTFTINQLNNTGLTQLVANPSSNTPLTYDWDFGNGQTLQSTNPTINYNFTPGDSLYICLTVTDSIGCVATSCQYYNVPTVPTCGVSFTITPINNPNPTTQLTATPTGTAPFIYDWDFGNGQTLQTTNPTINYNFMPGDSLYICLTVTDSIGCVATSCQYYNVPSVSTCTADFVYNQQDGTVHFVNTSTGSNFFIYNWNFGDGTISSSENPTHTYTTSGTYQVCLAISNLLGCTDTYCQMITVNIPNQNPCVADFDIILTGNTVQFVNQSTLDSNWSYTHWNFGDGDTSNLLNPTHTYTSNGIYVVCLTIYTPNCTDTHCDTLVINQSSNCQADFSYQMIGTNTVQFTNLSTSSTNGLTYVWDFGDGLSGNATHPQYTYPSPGQYLVSLTIIDSLGCTSTAYDSVNITTNTMEMQAIESVEISPNPVTDLMQIQLDLTQTTSVKVSIVTLTGQRIQTHNEALINGQHRLFMPTDNLPKGIYLLQINTENGVITKRFIKQ